MGLMCSSCERSMSAELGSVDQRRVEFSPTTIRIARFFRVDLDHGKHGYKPADQETDEIAKKGKDVDDGRCKSGHGAEYGTEVSKVWEATDRVSAGEDLENPTAQATNEKVRLFSRLGRLVLDPDIPDEQLRRRIFEEVASRELFATAVEETEQLLRPRDGSYLDFVENRYGHLRKFAPLVLRVLDFKSLKTDDPLTCQNHLHFQIGDLCGLASEAIRGEF